MFKRSNVTQNTVSNLLVVSWGTAQISTPALVSKKAVIKQRICDFGCIAKLKRITLKVKRKILPTYLKSLYKFLLRPM